MNLLEILFWTFIVIIFYAYFGYGILLIGLVKIKEYLTKNYTIINPQFEPTVTFIVPCYNEIEILQSKVINTLQLDYPKEKLQILFITDGSTDGSQIKLEQYEQVEVLHDPIRRGKSAAENRSVAHAHGEIIIISDANTVLPSNTIKNMVRHYINPEIGAVSGEKRIGQGEKENAAGAGEGFYWKYESLLKRFDARLHTVVGAAGELFSFRKHLFRPLEEDTILDDFVLSLRITQAGYRVMYDPTATATETASANSHEELKRKIRICAGGWQAMSRLGSLFNFFKHPILTFQYISHRVLRWTLAPLFLLCTIPFNILLAKNSSLYQIILFLHILFYLFAFLGYHLEKKELKIKTFFIPYYFTMMNYAAILGFFRFIKGNQSAIWEKSNRKLVGNNLK
ncbi:MAG: glycosyltransferase family 2 protein [Bacteroidia bacterium]|jgi:biofilm PGA synthesis N-glycosyltransferase PgaC|nr:glycosyltransferase family 2 protein [Bacteroidia bacterium]MBP7244033.1 glycosyltransferase family 2 protein [Bacteroidia bacterium]